MTIVLVHGLPETNEIWTPLLKILDLEAVAVKLPGFGTPRPEGFKATKDAYADWLSLQLKLLDPPVDIVGHDIGALLTMRIATAFSVSIRSWVVDVANIFHPRFSWPERVRNLQTPGLGEEILKTARTVDTDDPRSTVSRLVNVGVPPNLAMVIGKAHDDRMSQSILDFYRSAVPNVAADWWEDAGNPPDSQGLVLLLPDPPEVEAMSLEIAERLRAETMRLNDLDHCWMAQAPEKVASVLKLFWSSL